MTNLNIIQEINKQVTNFNHTQIHTGLDIITLMLPTLVATEFNQMVSQRLETSDPKRHQPHPHRDIRQYSGLLQHSKLSDKS